MYIKALVLIFLVFLTSGCFHRRHHTWSKEPAPPYQSEMSQNFKISKDNDSASFYQAMGMEYFKQSNSVKAKACFNDAVRLDAKLYWAWFYLGLIEIESPVGYEYLKKSSQVKPDFALSYYWMGYYQTRMHQNKKAIRLFKKYLKLAKNQPTERNRVRSANQALEELLSGTEGEALKEIRKSNY